jgi:cell division protein FtsB
MTKKIIPGTKVHAGSGGGYPLMRVIVLLFFLILFAVVGSMLVSQSRTFDRVHDKSQELSRLEREALANNDEVKTQQGKIGSDEYIEEIARDQLGLVKSGETVYQTGE